VHVQDRRLLPCPLDVAEQLPERVVRLAVVAIGSAPWPPMLVPTSAMPGGSTPNRRETSPRIVSIT